MSEPTMKKEHDVKSFDKTSVAITRNFANDPERYERETKEDSEWLLGTILSDDWNEEDNDPSNW
jgi:hypothetical protein